MISGHPPVEQDVLPLQPLQQTSPAPQNVAPQTVASPTHSISGQPPFEHEDVPHVLQHTSEPLQVVLPQATPPLPHDTITPIKRPMIPKTKKALRIYKG